MSFLSQRSFAGRAYATADLRPIGTRKSHNSFEYPLRRRTSGRPPPARERLRSLAGKARARFSSEECDGRPAFGIP